MGEKVESISDIATLPVVLRINPHVMSIMGVCKEQAYSLAHRKDFPSIKIGRSIRVPRDAFLRWLNEQASVVKEGKE
jgi:excisionase family DNA binding protein